MGGLFLLCHFWFKFLNNVDVLKMMIDLLCFFFCYPKETLVWSSGVVEPEFRWRTYLLCRNWWAAGWSFNECILWNLVRRMKLLESPNILAVQNILLLAYYGSLKSYLAKGDSSINNLIPLISQVEGSERIKHWLALEKKKLTILSVMLHLLYNFHVGIGLSSWKIWLPTS